MKIDDLDSFKVWLENQVQCKNLKQLAQELKRLWNSIDTDNETLLKIIKRVKKTGNYVENDTDNQLSIVCAWIKDIGYIHEFVNEDIIDEKSEDYRAYGMMLWKVLFDLMQYFEEDKEKIFEVILMTINYHNNQNNRNMVKIFKKLFQDVSLSNFDFGKIVECLEYISSVDEKINFN